MRHQSEAERAEPRRRGAGAMPSMNSASRLEMASNIVSSVVGRSDRVLAEDAHAGR